MSMMTHDTARSRQTLAAGLALALASAVTFSLSGPLASALFAVGWSPGAVVLVRVALGAAVVLPLGIASLRGDWSPVRRGWRLIVMYGLLGVALAQFAFFSAVERMPVGPALLIEYTAPAAVVAWMWVRHGQRPGRLTLGGVALAAVGLVLVLDLAGARLDPIGVGWALLAMVGASAYFVINARAGTGLPPFALAAGGLLVGAVAFALLAAVGLLPLSVGTGAAAIGSATVDWWVVLLALGLVTAGVAYVTGIGAGRRLGARLSSFVALGEVLSAVVLAWLILGEVPLPVQMLGGALVLAGVIAVQQGEAVTARRLARRAPEPSTPW